MPDADFHPGKKKKFLSGPGAQGVLQKPRRRDKRGKITQGHRGRSAQDHRRLRRLLQGGQRGRNRDHSQRHRLDNDPRAERARREHRPRLLREAHQGARSQARLGLPQGVSVLSVA